jgi:hypothetical protein
MPAGIGDHPLQSRGGKNTSPGPLTLFDGVKGAGKIVKLAARGDNVLVEGLKDRIRIVGIVAAFDLGSLLNRNGLGPAPVGDVSYTYHFIDAHGNEIEIPDSSGNVVEDGNDDLDNQVPTPNPTCAVFGFLENEKLVLRVTGGNPDLSAVTEGYGVYYVPTSIHDAENAICERIRIMNTYRTVIAAPPPGKTWQMPATSSYPCGASMLVMNFDPDPHTFDCFLVDSQGNELLVSNGDTIAAESIGNIFTDAQTSHMFPYPYRLEVRVTDTNPIGHLYVATLFAEFDLPKDQG